MHTFNHCTIDARPNSLVDYLLFYIHSETIKLPRSDLFINLQFSIHPSPNRPDLPLVYSICESDQPIEEDTLGLILLTSTALADRVSVWSIFQEPPLDRGHIFGLFIVLRVPEEVEVQAFPVLIVRQLGVGDEYPLHAGK